VSLFLYCGEKGLTWLRDGRLPFSEAVSLMDPFVCNTAVKQSNDSVAVSDSEFNQELKVEYDVLPESLSSLMTFEYFKEQALNNRESIEAKIRQRSLPVVSAISQKQQKALTLLCLYERADDPALWKNYGANHQGMVIELDQSHNFFSSAQFKDASQMFGPVKYGRERPLKLKETHPLASLFHRSEHFANEREWRLLRPASVSDKKISIDDYSVHLHRIPTSIIKSVTLGAAMTIDLKETLMSLLKADLRYRNIPIMACRLDQTQYLLHRVPVDRN